MTSYQEAVYKGPICHFQIGTWDAWPNSKPLKVGWVADVCVAVSAGDTSKASRHVWRDQAASQCAKGHTMLLNVCVCQPHESGFSLVSANISVLPRK